MCQHSPPTKQYEQARIVSESCFIKDHHGEGFRPRTQEESFFSPIPPVRGTCSHLDRTLLSLGSASPFWPGMKIPQGEIQTADPPFLISSPGGATVVSGYPEKSPGTSAFLPHPFCTPLSWHLVAPDALKGKHEPWTLCSGLLWASEPAESG